MATVKPYETAAGKRYRVRYRKPDGSQTDKRGFRTKKEAELFAASVTITKAQGDYVDPVAGRVTVGALGPKWLASRANLKESSLAAYRSAWKVHVEPKWGRWSVSAIEHSDVQEWIVWLGTAEGARKAKSPSLVRRCHDLLAGILDIAVKDKKIAANRARGVTKPRKVSREHIYLSHGQVAELADEAGAHGVLVTMLAYTGLRWGEMSALRVRDLDMLRGRVKVNRNAVYVEGHIVVGTPKTYQRREVPFPRFLAMDLARACEGKSPDELVFPDDHGDFLRTPSMRENSWWDKAIERAGLLPQMVPHDLRHTAASLAISAGANVKAVQRMLGHASAAMTLDTYADLFDDDLDSVAAALDVAATKARHAAKA